MWQPCQAPTSGWYVVRNALCKLQSAQQPVSWDVDGCIIYVHVKLNSWQQTALYPGGVQKQFVNCS